MSTADGDDEVMPCGLTLGELHRLNVESRLRQGLPPQIEDPVALRHIYDLLYGDLLRRRESAA